MFFNFTCIFMCLVIKSASSIDLEQSEKCCDHGSILNDRFECTKLLIENVDYGTVPKRLPDVVNETQLTYRHCLKSNVSWSIIETDIF